MGDAVSGIGIAKSLVLDLCSTSATPAEVVDACARAAELHLAAVRVWPVHVAVASSAIGGGDTRITAAIAAPHGQDTLPAITAAMEHALEVGASDVVVALDHSRGLAGDVEHLAEQAASILAWITRDARLGSSATGAVSIALETMLLEPHVVEEVAASLGESGIGFIHTGSGHQHPVVTDEHVRAVRGMVPESIGVAAIGGISTLHDARSLCAAGASRAVSAAAIAIVGEERMERQGGQAS